MDEDLAQDTLFLALTRPAMMWGLPLDAALMIAVVATALLLGLGNPIIALGVGAGLWFTAPGAAFDARKCAAGKKMLSIPNSSANPFLKGIIRPGRACHPLRGAHVRLAGRECRRCSTPQLMSDFLWFSGCYQSPTVRNPARHPNRLIDAA